MKVTLGFPGRESREITMLWLNIYTVEECSEFHNRFCLRYGKYISIPLLEFSLKFKRKITVGDKGCLFISKG